MSEDKPAVRRTRKLESEKPVEESTVKPILQDLLASAPLIVVDAKADLFREILLFDAKYKAWLTKVREVAGT